MKRGKNRSQSSIRSSKSEVQVQEEINEPPLDILTVNIKSLKIMDEDPSWFSIKVTFFDQLMLAGTIKAIGGRDPHVDKTLLSGTLVYDPSDYEKMCLFADCPLVVNIQPWKSVEPSLISSNTTSQSVPSSSKSATKSESSSKTIESISCCNVDILSLFIDREKMTVKKRMEPLRRPLVLYRKSWDNLPLLTMELTVTRNLLNETHHEVLKQSNNMTITLIAAYNMLIPYDEECVYTAASKLPAYNDTNTALVIFNQGHRIGKRFNNMAFYPHWESQRLGDDVFTKGYNKFVSKLDEFQNDENIDLKYYFKNFPNVYTTVWASFHRLLMLNKSEVWLKKHIHKFNWPLEVHIYGEKEGCSFMAFLDLFKFLYPGENKIRLAVPLQWINAEAMSIKCGCELLLTPNEKASTPTATATLMGSTQASNSIDASLIRPATGADGNSAFVLVEITLARPLIKVSIPPHIHKPELKEMLTKMEEAGPNKRECTGRGQLDRDWQSTVRSAASSLRKVPYHGMTEFCAFNRQLSETRTRVELTTSFWQDAAVYVNNSFIVRDFLRSPDTFEEMLMMAHACLMRTACDTLVGVDEWQNINPVLRAARHARQMQDIPHAMELYLQRVVENPRCSNSWRELSTCLLEVDRDWAKVCINKSIMLDPRNPLSLLCKGCMVFDENPEEADTFFTAILTLYPFWTTAWVIISAYYNDRELFYLADQIIEYNKKTIAEGLPQDMGKPRAWEHELGDWWDYTPLLPGMNRYYDAADLLLRLRAISLAELCVSRALTEVGESAAYFHLVALCCRLREKYDDALCFIQAGIEKYGEISYLRSLEAECYHKQNNIQLALATFEKAGTCVGGYSILLSTANREPQRTRSVLVDLARRQPSAYAWVALADDWMMRFTMGEGGDAGVTDEQAAAKTCAVACAVQALKWDRRAGAAWALLAKLVKPSARRLHCRNMAIACDYDILSEERSESASDSKQSLCYRLSKALRGCRCVMCKNIQF